MHYDRKEDQGELHAVQKRGRFVHAVVVRVGLDAVDYVEVVGDREVRQELVLEETSQYAEQKEAAQDQAGRKVALLGVFTDFHRFS